MAWCYYDLTGFGCIIIMRYSQEGRKMRAKTRCAQWNTAIKCIWYSLLRWNGGFVHQRLRSEWLWAFGRRLETSISPRQELPKNNMPNSCPFTSVGEMYERLGGFRCSQHGSIYPSLPCFPNCKCAALLGDASTSGIWWDLRSTDFHPWRSPVLHLLYSQQKLLRDSVYRPVSVCHKILQLLTQLISVA